MLKKVEHRFEKLEQLLLTQEEAATMLRTSPTTFWQRFVESKKIKIVWLDAMQRNPLFYKRDVEYLIETSKIEWNKETEKIVRKKVG